MAGILTRLRSTAFKYPVVGNMLICGTMYGAGDISQQTLRKLEHYDLKNLARVATVACVFFGPIYYRWYKILDRLIKGRTTREILLKVVVDQAVIAPPFISIFYVATSVLEGQEDKFKQLREKGPKTFLTGCFYWLPAQCINFIFLPTYLRTSYVAVCSFVWTNILCFIKSTKSESPETDQVEIKHQ